MIKKILSFFQREKTAQASVRRRDAGSPTDTAAQMEELRQITRKMMAEKGFKARGGIAEDETPEKEAGHPVYPDLLSGMKVEILVSGKNREVWILHEKPIESEVAWVEYDMEDDSLILVAPSGKLHPLGAKIQPKLKPHMAKAKTAYVICTKNGEVFDCFKLSVAIRGQNKVV